MTVVAEPLTPEWHEARRRGIGASEIAAVLGISPWESPFSLYWRKVNGWQYEQDPAMEWGTRLEPAIAAKYENNHPEFYVHPCGLRVGPQPWMLATPDRLLCDHQMHDNPFPNDPSFEWKHADELTIGLLELKTARTADGWGEPGTAEIPVHYRAQAQWQMLVVDVEWADIAVLIAGSDYREYHVQRDEKDLTMMVEHGRRFLARLDAGDPPPIDGHSATLAAIRQLHLVLTDDTVDVPTDVAAGYLRAVAMQRTAEKARMRYEARLREAMGTARKASVDGRHVATRVVADVAEATISRAAHRRDYLLPARSSK